MAPVVSMKAAVLDSPNAPFRVADLTRPTPGGGQVLVRIEASGVNPLDAKIRAGQAAHARHPMSAVLGLDLAGVVEEIGPGVTIFKPGEAVYGMTGGVGGLQGSLAQYALADSELLAPKPRNLSVREAAALPLIFITAWEGLVDRANVGRGQKARPRRRRRGRPHRGPGGPRAGCGGLCHRLGQGSGLYRAARCDLH